MANQGGDNSVMATRECRKGNWTVSETMVLIEAKKMDDERRLMKRITTSSSSSSTTSEAIRNINKPAELRWKWVEDYCWNKGCCRNQNQCNDKWDNLMRDYKKVREYERRLMDEDQESSNKSYWKLEKNERKERNLPSNLLLQIYEALVDVVERRGGGHHQPRITAAAAAAAATSTNSGLVGCNVVDVERPMVNTSVVPLLQHHQVSSSSQVLLPLPPPPPPPLRPRQPSLPPPPPPPSQSTQPPLSTPLPTMSDRSGSDTSEYSDSPAKRRRRGGGGGGEGTSGGGGGGATTFNASTSNEVGHAITKSTSIIVEAIQASEEREERRHKELLSFHERRLRIEESKTEINRQGINGLVDSINNLATSILALASHKNQSTPPK